jgi:drug/metabolite transporter (DMT)-like permease
MPVWALLASVIVYKARLTARAVAGVVLALAATYLLAIDEIQQFTGQPLGLVFILSAAIFWGIGNAMIKHTPLTISTAVLNFWSLTISCVLGFVIAAATEAADWRWPSAIEWAGVFYNSVVAFALGYVAWFTVARKLSAVTSGLSIMLVPVVAVFGGAFWLSEAVAWQDLLALTLILAAMAAVLLPARRSAATT